MKTRIFYMVMALVLTAALAVPLLSATPVLAADTDYDFSNLTIKPHYAYYCDVNGISGSPTVPDVNSKSEAGSQQYGEIAVSNDLRWQTPDPGRNDYVFMWFDMIIAETPTNIDLTFEGYGEITGTFQIWADNTTDGWDKIGSDQEVTTGTDYTMTRSISGLANCANYIDGSGLLRWGVFFHETTTGIMSNGYWVKTDYVETVVTGSSGTYNFCFSSAHDDDVNSMGIGGPSIDDSSEASAAEYVAISDSDNSRWQTQDPGSNDEIFVDMMMVIAENPGDITNIELWFEGYGSGGGSYQIWAYNNNTSLWDTIGTSEYISSGSGNEETFHRSIGSNCDHYINGCGLLRWGVYFSNDSESVSVDYVKAVVTVPGPGINIDKVALESEVAAGETIHYTYNVTNNTGLGNITDVTVIDDTCTSLSGPIKTGGNLDDTLEDNELWTYTCEYVTDRDDLIAGLVHNTANATGKDPGQNTVEDTGEARVDVTAPTPVANPLLEESCGLDIVLVIDGSGSISGPEYTQMKTIFKDFVEAFLDETPTEFAVVEYAGNATVRLGFTGTKTTIKDEIDEAREQPGSKWTNWEHALITAHGLFPNRDNPDLIIFASNGEPNRADADPFTLVAEPMAVALAALEANSIKSDGIRIVVMSIWDQSGPWGNDVAISGPNVDPPGSIVANTDVITDNFGDLDDILADLADECLGTIIVEKVTDPSGGTGFAFTDNIGLPNSFSLDHGQIKTFTDVPIGLYNVTEDDPMVTPGCYNLTDLVCVEDKVSNSTPNLVNRQATIILEPGETVTCTFTNTELDLVMTIDKDVVTDPPVVEPGGEVTYQIAVVNTGTADATGVYIWDVLPTGFLYAIGTDSFSYDGGASRSPDDDFTNLSEPHWGKFTIPSSGGGCHHHLHRGCRNWCRSGHLRELGLRRWGLLRRDR